ncbi:MAG: hypothetical protein Q8907_11510 [Bacteroidota bacterium]|nr:hypothetical protein [Bacteroidota bacterium]MDP4226703.1 hypothetical protein [Bacteroidota bacterium]MDP4274894.1 hypothetical protein [Bacteroidota bacterium]
MKIFLTLTLFLFSCFFANAQNDEKNLQNQVEQLTQQVNTLKKSNSRLNYRLKMFAASESKKNQTLSDQLGMMQKQQKTYSDSLNKAVISANFAQTDANQLKKQNTTLQHRLGLIAIILIVLALAGIISFFLIVNHIRKIREGLEERINDHKNIMDIAIKKEMQQREEQNNSLKNDLKGLEEAGKQQEEQLAGLKNKINELSEQKF